MDLSISGASQAYFSSLKGCYTNADTKECPHSQTSLKVSDSEEKLTFSFRLPLRCYIAQLAMFSSDPGILLNLCASAPHPHTTLAIGE